MRQILMISITKLGIAEWEIIQRVRDRVVKLMMVMPFVLE